MASSRKQFRFITWWPVHLPLYFLLRMAAAAAAMVPARHLRVVARFLGTFLRWIDRKHVKFAATNLEHVGYGGDIPSMVRRVYEHTALQVLEMIVVPRLMRHHGVPRYVRFHHLERLDAGRAGGKGVIVVIGHLGNWELVGLAITMLGYPLRSLARPIANPFIDRWLLRARTSTGQGIIAKHGALREMMAVLRRNEILVIQVDQDAKTSGVVVRFLGRPASTVRSAALLALKYGSPIVTANIYRDAHGLHHAVIGEPIDSEDYAGRPDAVRAITQEYTLRFESFVREHPEQWLWLHPRWRSYIRGKVAEEPVEAGAGRG